MRKLSSALLMLLFAGMQNLVADGHEGKLTVKINPYAEGKGKIYLSGDEYRKLDNPVTIEPDGSPIAVGGVNFSADYKGIGGVQVDLKGGLSVQKSSFGLGDNAYAYIHILEAFGLDKEIFDVYLKSGRFELGFVKDSKDGKYGKGGKLKRDNQINMQLDLKILNMVTVTTGVAFNPFEQKDRINKDIGFMVEFDRTFADAHKVTASVGYSVDLTNNEGNDMNGDSRVGTKKESDIFLDRLVKWEKGEGEFAGTDPLRKFPLVPTTIDDNEDAKKEGNLLL